MCRAPGAGRRAAARGRVLCLAALLVLAGCSGPVADTGDEPAEAGTLTPVPVPETGGGTLDELAPGVTDAGVVDARRLAAAHARALANVSYTVRRNVTRRAPDGTLRAGTTSLVRTSATRDRFRYTLVLRRGDRRVIDRYADGRRIYEREERAGATTYELVRGPGGAPLRPRNASYGDAANSRGIANLFSRFRFVVTDRVERNGTTYYRIETPEPQAVPPAYDVVGTALVSERGVVREYSLSYRIVRGGEGGTEESRVDVRVRFSDVGSTTVPEPAWYAEALAATNATATSTPSPDADPAVAARPPVVVGRSRVTSVSRLLPPVRGAPCAGSSRSSWWATRP